MRADGRKPDELRPVAISTGVSPYAEGSCEICFGRTKVLVAASVERNVPPWMKEGMGGWITAEYGMLPRATHQRNRREAAAGKQGGRTLEIQRLIGRALRQAIDIKQLEGVTIQLDCDVLVADGGTRTAAITGAWLALAQAVGWGKAQGVINPDVQLKQVAAISVGVVGGVPMADLSYEEDSGAEFDLNLVMNEAQAVIEIQGTAERAPLSLETMMQLVNLGSAAIRTLLSEQRKHLR